MLFFALRVLGFGKRILDLAIQHWKIVLPVVIIVVQFFVVSNIYFDKGVDHERSKWEARIKAEAAKNEKLTNQIAEGTKQYGEAAAEEDKARVEKEIVYQNKIKTIIQEKPVYKECKTDEDVLSQLNALRSLGE
jgi:hypothetical protein